MYAIGRNDSARPGSTMYWNPPQPPVGNDLVAAASISSKAAVTKLGRLMPISAMLRLVQSAAPPRFTAAIVPTPTPTSTAIDNESIPSATDTGSAVLMMSLTDHSRYCIDGPKSRLTKMLYGYHRRNCQALLAWNRSRRLRTTVGSMFRSF